MTIFADLHAEVAKLYAELEALKMLLHTKLSKVEAAPVKVEATFEDDIAELDKKI